MTNTAFINSAKLDYDDSLDYSALKQYTNLSKFNAHTIEEILEALQHKNIIITK